MLLQYSECNVIFHACKYDNFHTKNCDVCLVFYRKVDYVACCLLCFVHSYHFSIILVHDIYVIQRLGAAEISTLWHFRYPQLVKMPIKNNFFPQTIRDWNDLPDSLISSAGVADNCVSKFTSLVRARD